VREASLVPEAVLGALMLVDVVVLTGLLLFTGGPFNPFSTLYLVNIALAAVILRPGWTWALVVISLLCFGALFVEPLRGGAAWLHGEEGHVRLHLEGMWVAFGVGAVFIAYFVRRVTSELARREGDLAETRAAQARAERLAALGTLAAGAAHELSTPLSTIAVVARELERRLAGSETGSAVDLSEDARLVREQVDRCRRILEQMAADAGDVPGESFVDLTLPELIDASTGDLARDRLEVVVESAARGRPLQVPRRAVAQALRAITKNALEASPASASVRDGGECRIEVRDQGGGMSEDVLARVGDPFFTTKHPGAGMGLGVFLAQTVLARLGGGLELLSRPGAGTTARLRIPTDALAAPARAADPRERAAVARPSRRRRRPGPSRTLGARCATAGSTCVPRPTPTRRSRAPKRRRPSSPSSICVCPGAPGSSSCASSAPASPTSASSS
jgi:two-component system sensor histidine kinase RegB